jgi:hypothetical protein
MKKMEYKVTEKPQEKRQIGTCKENEAFLWGDSWYIKATLRDDEIENFGDFLEAHLIEDGVFTRSDWCYCDFMPVIEIREQTLHYMHKKIVPNDWADIQLSIMPK